MNIVAEVSIIDYGLGNLKSICGAFRHIGISYEIVSSSYDVSVAKRLILPGVGAFGDGMSGLRRRKLVNVILDKVASGTPLLGICLGMQLLFSESLEFGCHKGLNLIEGQVVPFSFPHDIACRVPHTGWNTIELDQQKITDSLLLKIPTRNDMYFVHSFYAVPTDENNIIARTKYGNLSFCSWVKNRNIIGTQFHPEKSGGDGLRLLYNFAQQKGCDNE